MKLTFEPTTTPGPMAARSGAAAWLGTMLAFGVGCTSTIGGSGDSGASGAQPGVTGGSGGSTSGSGGAAQGGGNQGGMSQGGGGGLGGRPEACVRVLQAIGQQAISLR